MSDLIERLRHADIHSQQRVLGSRIFGEAADRIESLEREVEKLRKALETVRANLVRLAWEENTLMIEGIDAALSAAAQAGPPERYGHVELLRDELHSAACLLETLAEGLPEDDASAVMMRVMAQRNMAALSATWVVGWQPIETAPKDGTEVDLWCVRQTSGGPLRIASMWWTNATGWRNGNRDPKIEALARSATHWRLPPAPPVPSDGRMYAEMSRENVPDKVVKASLRAAALCQSITVGGKQYRKFIPYPQEVDDGTLRCIACGQIDEEEFHDNDLCVAAHPAQSAPVETLYRWRGPKGGWIYDAKKPSWHSEQLEVRAAQGVKP